MSNDEKVAIIHKATRAMSGTAKQLAEDLEWLSTYNADYDPATYENVRQKIMIGLLNMTQKLSTLPTLD